MCSIAHRFYRISGFAVVLFAVCLTGCELFDPPPSAAQVDLAMGDMEAGIASTSSARLEAVRQQLTTANNAAGTVSVIFPAGDPTPVAGTWTYTFSAYQGATYKLTGSITYVKTSDSDYTASGTVKFAGGTVTSITYNDVVNTATSSSGIITINGKYKYDAETGQRVFN
jgi:hypothetical protein